MNEPAHPANEWFFERVESGAYSLGYGNENDGYECFPILASDLAALQGLVSEVQNVLTLKGRAKMLDRPSKSPTAHLTEIRTVIQAYLREHPQEGLDD